MVHTLADDGWIRTAADLRAWHEGYRPDVDAAERVRRFFSGVLRHSKGQWAGEPFELLPWQWEDVIKPLFSWRRPDGTRRFRVGYVSVPKKQGKSTLCAGLALYLLVADDESGAEVYTAAADRDQASIVFNESDQMVAASPILRGLVKRIPSRKSLVAGGSVYRALAADVATNEGLNISGLIFDELHTQKSRDFWDALRYGGAARRQPLILAITTAGFDRESICYEQYQYARGVLDGTNTDPSFFAYIAEADAEDDWQDEAVWRKANPSLGVTINMDSFRGDFEEAKQSTRKQNSFRRYRLNQWTEQGERWLDMDRWDACQQDIDWEEMRGRRCYAGLDLASTTDTASLALVFPPDDEVEEWCVLLEVWAPEDSAGRRTRHGDERYKQWAREKWLTLTDGEVIDYDVIRARINALGKVYDIREIAIDRWNATQLATQLDGDGFVVAAFGQGYASMSDPSKRLESLILSRAIAHDGNPVLRWMIGNAASQEDAAGNLKPSKDRAADKIDGVVAMIMGIGRGMVSVDDKPSVYDTDPNAGLVI